LEEDEVVRLLASIDRRLALLTASQERDLRRALDQKLLRSEGRIRMFASIDGRRTSPEIAKAAGVSERAVQLFVKELLDAGLVRDTGTGTGRAVVVAHDDGALARWYVSQESDGGREQ
jgi:Fic family protein